MAEKTKNYKLTEEIKQFIINKKKADPRLSCRGLVTVVYEQFHITLSKSLINNVIKEKGLSSPVGRRRVREAPVPKKLPETEKKLSEVEIIREKAEFLENCGFYFLKAADLKLGFTSQLSEILSGYIHGLSKQSHRGIIETLIYTPHFKDKRSLSIFTGAEVPEETLTQYSRQALLIPFPQLRESVKKLGIDCNSNEINKLWKESLLRLNSYIVHFFPPEYQFFDFSALKERFYCLPGKLERKEGLLVIQLFYPISFQWLNDVIWQEGFSSAANKVNDAKIITPENEQIWISPQVEFR